VAGYESIGPPNNSHSHWLSEHPCVLDLSPNCILQPRSRHASLELLLFQQSLPRQSFLAHLGIINIDCSGARTTIAANQMACRKS